MRIVINNGPLKPWQKPAAYIQMRSRDTALAQQQLLVNYWLIIYHGSLHDCFFRWLHCDGSSYLHTNIMRIWTVLGLNGHCSYIQNIVVPPQYPCHCCQDDNNNTTKTVAAAGAAGTDDANSYGAFTRCPSRKSMASNCAMIQWLEAQERTQQRLEVSDWRRHQQFMNHVTLLSPAHLVEGALSDGVVRLLVCLSPALI